MNPHLIIARNVGLTVGAGVLAGCGLHTWILKRMNSFDQEVFEQMSPNYSVREIDQLRVIGCIYRLEKRNRMIYRVKAVGIAACIAIIGIVVNNPELLPWQLSTGISSIGLKTWDALAVAVGFIGIYYFYEIPYQQWQFLNEKSKLKFYTQYLKSR